MKTAIRVLLFIYFAVILHAQDLPRTAPSGFDVAMRLLSMRLAFSLERTEALGDKCSTDRQFVADDSGIDYVRRMYPQLSKCDKLKLAIALSCILGEKEKRDHILDLRELFRNDAAELRGKFEPKRRPGDLAVVRAFRASPKTADSNFKTITAE